jgi:hypothetical protein
LAGYKCDLEGVFFLAGGERRELKSRSIRVGIRERDFGSSKMKECSGIDSK